jgi:hypothetical protein
MLNQITELEFRTLATCEKLFPFLQEKEWWAAANEAALGAIVFDHIDSDWSLVILGRDEYGTFRAIDLAVSLPSRETARAILREKMEQYCASEAMEFPPDPPL